MVASARPHRAHVRAAHSTLREGVIVGVLGACAVALWFLLIDSSAGRPLRTPALLGAIVSRVADPIAAADGSARFMLAALYTPIHVVLFVLFGLLVVFLMHRAQQMPSLLMLALLLFAVFELGFTGLVAMLAQTALGSLAWYQVAVGNLIAVVVMAWYLARRHPGLRAMWQHSLDDGDRPSR